jgi:hypothetical protein
LGLIHNREIDKRSSRWPCLCGGLQLIKVTNARAKIR